MHCPVCRLPDLRDALTNPNNYCITGGATHGKCVYLLEDIFEDLADNILPSKRENQYALAKSVAKALSYPTPETSALLIEGGTGLGKTYAYLIPIILDMQELILHNKQNPEARKLHRAIISTANKALQTQLIQKDIPTLIQQIDPTIKFCSIKGNTNYACLQATIVEPNTSQQKKYLDFIATAIKSKKSAELSAWDGPVPPWWNDCSVEHCIKPKGCPHYDYCKPRVKNYDIVVTNHAKLGYGLNYESVFGDIKTLVIDEAHQGPSYFRSAFELECNTATLDKLISQIGSDQILLDVWPTLHNPAPLIPYWVTAFQTLKVDIPNICDTMETDAAGIVKATYELVDTHSIHPSKDRLHTLQNDLTAKQITWVEYSTQLMSFQNLCSAYISTLTDLETAWSSYIETHPGDFKNSSGFSDFIRSVEPDIAINLFNRQGVSIYQTQDARGKITEDFVLNDCTRAAYAHTLKFITKAFDFITSIQRCIETYQNLLATTTVLAQYSSGVGGRKVLVRSSEYDPKTKRVELTLKLTPLDLGHYLNERIKGIPVRIALSATMTVDGSFAYMQQNLGFRTRVQDHIHNMDMKRYASPFDYKTQVLTWLPTTTSVCPTSIPNKVITTYLDPVHPYEIWCKNQIDIIHKTVNLCNGNTFVLFSSTQNMKAIHKRLMDYKDWPSHNPIILHDGNADAALRQYHENPNSVLLGCKSFWEGIDIPGDKLKGIIITQLPFGHPGNLELTLLQKLASGNSNVFMSITYPYMLFQLLQGTGRLIRTMTDTGILVISDPRVRTATYGARIQKNLPVIRTVTSDFTKLKKNYIERGY